MRPWCNTRGRCGIKKQRVLDFVAARGWSLIGEAEWLELRAALPDISESTVRGAGVSIAQPWCGVRQHTLDELETSLCELSEVYAKHPHLRPTCREQVIAAKARARFLSRKNELKKEMVEWMLVWLGDPAMFPAWATLRRERIP
jgi:hypothetical protein